MLPCSGQRVFSLFVYKFRSRPRSRLFPYTTLFRSKQIEALPRGNIVAIAVIGDSDATHQFHHEIRPSFVRDGTGERSEEHTSELQSLRHLVCRLLLEKKKRRSHEQIA